MAKANKKSLPDEEVKSAIVEKPKKSVSVKVLGTIIKPLSETKDKNDTEAISNSSLRSPLELLLLHEYAKHEIEEHSEDDSSEDSLVHAIKDILKGVQRENCEFLKSRESYEKDLGILSSVLSSLLPKTVNLKNLIAQSLFGNHSESSDLNFKKDIYSPSMEVLKLLK